MDFTIISTLIGMAAGLVQAFDIPIICPTLSYTGAHVGTIEVAETTVGGIPLSQFIYGDFVGACTTSNGLGFKTPDSLWVARYT